MPAKTNINTPQKQKLVADICRRYPDAGNRTLARKLRSEAPLLFQTLNAADCAVRHHRGGRGKTSKCRAEKRGTCQKPRIPPIPKARSEDWTPFVLDTKRNLVIGDLHVPFHNVNAIEAALSYGDKYNPDAVIINGDFVDFFELSRFDKQPDVVKVDEELALGREMFLHIRARFPRAKLIWKLGNHDLRWPKYIFNTAPLLSGVKQVVDGWMEPIGVLECNVTVVDDDRPIMLGKLPLLHGHELGGSGGVNPARAAFLKANHTVMVNHFHRTSSHGDTNLWHDESMSWSVGCLCGKTPRWMRNNKWNWGFACVTVYSGGEYDVQNMRISNDYKVRAS